jgi:hypothetical protein
MSWLDCALAALATWRFTHLLVVEQGPWNAIGRLRSGLSGTILGEALDCFYCSSLLVSILMAAVLGRTFLDYFLLWPALSAAAILLENISASFAPPVASYVEQEELNDELLREEQRQRSARRP